MPNPQVQNDPIINLPFLYKTGLILSNDATTPHSVLDISAGQCRDSNDIIDMTVGSVNVEGEIEPATLTVSSAVNGVNGLDTGTVAASTMYAIYIIGDSRYYNQTAAIITLASNSAPLMPFGYDSYRLIGYWGTDSSSYWYVGYYSGIGSSLLFTYDALQATAVTAGAQTAYTTPVNLIKWVPNVNNTPVQIYTNFSANAAADTLTLAAGASTSSGGQAVITAPVVAGTAHVTTISTILAQTIAISTVSSPAINYKVSSGSDAVAIYVAGFNIAV